MMRTLRSATQPLTKRLFRTPTGRLLVMAVVAASTTLLSFASSFNMACQGPDGNWYGTNVYCNDPSYQCLSWADNYCTCNQYGNCWIQNWQCSSCGS